MRVLGLSFSGHGSSICLVEDGRITGALNLERITRKKFSLVTLPGYEQFHNTVRRREYGDVNDAEYFNFYDVFPRMLRYVTGEGSLREAGIDLVVKTQDNIARVAHLPPHHQAKLDSFYQRFLEYFGGVATTFDVEHHLAHAYQAYLCSPYEEAAVLTVDGTGEKLERLGFGSVSMSLGSASHGRVRGAAEVCSPSSIGGVYSNVTRHLGFGEHDEGKTMALASFGGDASHREVRDTYALEPDGCFRFELNDILTDVVLNERMRDFVPPREHGEPITSAHEDLAWAVQRICEDITCHAARGLHAMTGQERLVVAGGVGLNCVANHKILEHTPIRELYVMPNAGDRGLAAGCALFGYHVVLGGHQRHPLAHDFLGRSYGDDAILMALRHTEGISWRRCEDVAAETAAMIEGGAIIGWFQGGSEFGPRALGHRSILADPRTKLSKQRLDNGIKRREGFRPYAPSMLAEHCHAWFELIGDSPFMLLAARVRPEVREKVPGIVHVDGSARIQTVERASNPRYYELIAAFHRSTGVPMLLNTSFNRVGEPIVETPRDAIECLLATDLDALVIETYLVTKGRQ